MDKKRTILFIASWLPNRTDAFVGDFILRHATAIAPFSNLKVLYIGKDASLKNKKFEVIQSEENGVEIIRVYYKEFDSVFKFLNQIVSFIRYFTAFFIVLKILKKENFKIELVHCNVLMKSGLLGLWLKNFHKIPYIISEHWSIYLPENGFYQRQNFIYKFISRKIAANATLIAPVSNTLMKALQNNGFQSNHYTIVPNVVDTKKYFHKPHIADFSFKFFHVSTLFPVKNIDRIIAAFLAVQKKNPSAELNIIGGEQKDLIRYEKYFNIASIKFHGLKEHNEIPELLSQADCFVLFSQYENLPCVIIESLAVGVPVISSDVGGVKEMINDENGILVESENEKQLIEKMIWMIENQNHFDRKKIAENASAKYSYETIGKKIADIYHQILSEKE